MLINLSTLGYSAAILSVIREKVRDKVDSSGYHQSAVASFNSGGQNYRITLESNTTRYGRLRVAAKLYANGSERAQSISATRLAILLERGQVKKLEFI